MIDPRSPNYDSPPFSPERTPFAYAPRTEVPDRLNADLAEPPRTPAVTVITPFFNTGPVFHATAAAVLGQSLQNFEWIIVNDCSTDPAALATLAEYRPGGARNPAADPRIRVVDHALNHGLSAARNTGFRSARAPFVFQLDSDDLIEPTTLEKCALFLEANPAFAFAKGFSVGFEGQEYLWEKGFHDRERFLHQNLVTATAMIRREVHERIGGFDETIRGGMEDWEFWLRAASSGHWGATIPEFLDWYRRRPPQVFDAWANLKCEEANRRFKEWMHREHAALFEGGFPDPQRPWHMPHEALWGGPEFHNPLAKPEGRKRLLMIIPWFRMGGADRFNIDLVKFLTSAGWDVTVVATLSSGTGTQSHFGNGHPWLADFAKFTPDVFILPHLGQPPQFPALSRHLIDSRRPDVVMVTNSEQGYAMLPWLRTVCPEPVYIDFNHMEEPQWKAGGHPRQGAASQPLLDLNITVSHHLKRWMCEAPRSASPDRIEVCHINADTRKWKPDTDLRADLRSRLNIPQDAVVILYAARLCAQKQPLVFADSILKLRRLLPTSPEGGGPLHRASDEAGGGASFRRPHSPIHVLIAGDGELELQLRQALAPLSPLDSRLAPSHPDTPSAQDPASLSLAVHFLGPVPTDDMPAVMAASDIFFLPSQWEGIALSIYEAMAAGLAIIGATVGGQRELVTPDTGILLDKPDNDPELEASRYAEALTALIADEPRRRALGLAARRRIVEHFELDNMGARMLDLFNLAARHKSLTPRPALDAHLASELTRAAIESLRAQELADYLWQYRVRWYDLQAQHRDTSAADSSDSAAEHALRYIESSALYRLVRSCKRLPLYGLVARARFGPEWQRELEAFNSAPPAERLDRIRNSAAYKAMVTVKKLPPVKVVSRLRHGREFRDHIPEPLRND